MSESPDDPTQSSPSRPTPVRESMKGSGGGLRAARGSGAAEAEARPLDHLVVENEVGRWILRAAGATRSGWGPDSGAPLLHVTFALAESPDQPLFEALAVASSIEDLGISEAEALLDRSRPIRRPNDPK